MFVTIVSEAWRSLKPIEMYEITCTYAINKPPLTPSSPHFKTNSKIHNKGIHLCVCACLCVSVCIFCLFFPVIYIWKCRREMCFYTWTQTILWRTNKGNCYCPVDSISLLQSGFVSSKEKINHPLSWAFAFRGRLHILHLLRTLSFF